MSAEARRVDGVPLEVRAILFKSWEIARRSGDGDIAELEKAPAAGKHSETRIGGDFGDDLLIAGDVGEIMKKEGNRLADALENHR